MVAEAAATAAPPVADAALRYAVAVRAMCEFTAREGDLDLRFTPAPTAQQGIAGHGLVAARRGAGYEKEVALAGSFELLDVRGRADGYDAGANRLEEVKTVRGSADRVPANQRQLHWAQLKVYGWLLCHERALADVTLALVYFDIESEHESVLAERWSAADLELFFRQQCRLFLDWARQESAHRLRRNALLERLAFPFPAFRTGQRELAESVFKAISTGRDLLAQAPTGIGKSAATLFPALKAMVPQQLDQLFFLAAKTPGRQVALSTLARLLPGDADGRPRTLELIAREKACEHPDRACHGESCPLARGFYDRLPAARSAATERPILDRASIRTVALDHAICPYYLAQEMTRWSDVVVGDYNYYFDSSALLFGLTQSEQRRVAVLVDEAHNLVERGRDMYSATLAQPALLAARRVAPAALRKPLTALQRAWLDLNRSCAADYQVYAEVPLPFRRAVQRASAAMSEQLAEQPLAWPPDLLQLHFDLLRFQQLAERFGDHSLCDVTLLPMRNSDARRSHICLRNVVPAPFLAERFDAAHSVTLFSATLTPRHYYRDLLGLASATVAVDVPSPFAAEQLRVALVGDVSTRYRDRAASLPALARLMAGQYLRQPGNYLAFFSSFDYLEQAAAMLREQYAQLPLRLQHRSMSEAERLAFLDSFRPGGQGIGLVVLGGAFAEGVDLPGDRLIGAFIATLGLPQLNPVNEQLRERMERLFGAGYDYTYLFPGLQKVVQAAGRVIRDESDRGCLYLLDDRYLQRRVRDLLPAWWRPQRISTFQAGGD